MTWKDAAILVLNDIGNPLHPDDILKEIFLRKLKTTEGYTPVLTLRTDMYRACSGHEHISKHSGELIFYEEDGKFGLYNWINNIPSSDNLVTNKYVVNVENISTVKEQAIEIHFQDEDDEVVFIEGKEKYLLHKTKERKTGLITLIKSKMFRNNPDLPCFVCGFSFSKNYGEHGYKFIEAHHLTPISELTEETKTKLEDIVLVCSNCHKMIHRYRPWLSIDELKNILNKQTAS